MIYNRQISDQHYCHKTSTKSFDNPDFASINNPDSIFLIVACMYYVKCLLKTSLDDIPQQFNKEANNKHYCPARHYYVTSSLLS